MSWFDSVGDVGMESLVYGGCVALLKAANPKKHARLRQEANQCIKHIQQQNNKNAEAMRAAGPGALIAPDTDANKYFLVFKLACDTGVSKLMCLSLDIIQKLISFGYLDGTNNIDTRIYTNPNVHQQGQTQIQPADGTEQQTHTQRAISDVIADGVNGVVPLSASSGVASADSTSDLSLASLTSMSPGVILAAAGSDGKLMSVLIDTLYHCACYRDQQVQLLVLKCVLTCVTSASCSVHGWSLLQAVSTCYQIYLANPTHTNNAGEEINRVTAKATLTQIFNLVFQRMEHFAAQLKQMQAVQQQMQQQHQAAPTNAPPTALASASPAPALTPSPDPNPRSSPSSASDASVGSGPVGPGRRGYCTVCGRPANHYSLHTKDVVCGIECKLINLRQKDPEQKLTNQIMCKLIIQLELCQNDAYYLLRALCKLAIKVLPPTAGTDKTDVNTIAVDSKILSLQLLVSILSNAGPTFRTTKHFIACVKGDIVNVILRNSAASSIETIFALSSSLFVSLVCHFKPHLHAVIGPVLDSIYLPYIASPNSTFEHKYISLTVLQKIALDPQTLLEIFINYDSLAHGHDSLGNTFQKYASTIEKVCRSRFVSENWLSSGEEAKLRLLALECLVETIKSLLIWTKRAQANLIARKEESDAAGRRAINATGEEEDSDEEIESTTSTRQTKSMSNAHRSQIAASTPLGAGEESTSVSMQQFHASRAQKQKLDTGVLKFNMRPKKGLAYLESHGMLRADSPVDVARFFLSNQGALDKVQVGDFLGDEHEFNKKVLYAYTEALEFRQMTFDDAIRKFLNGFWLPGEAQKIDRMMEKFAEQYHRHNPGNFSSADTAYVLAYSVIMLNTDAHSPNVKYRMTKEDFFKNCRGIDDGKDIDPVFLGDIYDRITTHEIKMKDGDPYRRMGKSGKEVMKQDRINMFVAESQELVKKTQDYLDNFHKKHDHSHSGSDSIGSSAAHSLDPSKRRPSLEDTRAFQLATDSDIEAVRPIFEILWYPSLATFSVLLEENEAKTDENASTSAAHNSHAFRIIDLCLDGYRHAIRLSSALGIETSRLAFVTSLRKFTLLGSTREMKQANIEAIKMLLLISHTEGNYLQDSWMDVLQCISELERLHLFASSRPIADVFQSTPMRTRESDSLNSLHVNKIDASSIDRVFTSSAHLDATAIVDFVKALKAVSEQELSNLSAPRVFSLQKIVEITYHNMGRIRVVWSKIWSILSSFFTRAGCHPNLNVSMYAIDSLRQLAMKFLEKDELASFQFQKQFFKPFELIMLNNTSNETRELIVQCMQRMVASRVTNIKSGWKGVFVVIHTAASQTYQPLVVAAFELLVSIMENHFNLLTTTTDTMDDCVNALVAFGCNNFTAISLKAIHYITQCCDHLGSQQVLRREKLAARIAQAESAAVEFDVTPTRSRASSNTQANSDLAIAVPGTPIAASSDDELDVGLLSPSSSSDASSSTMQMDLKIWFLALTGLSRMVLDPRPEVRSRALVTLFKILASHGVHFSSSTWRAVFCGVLFPIFDDVRHSSDPKKRGSSASGSGSESSTPIARDEPPAAASRPGGWSSTHRHPSVWRNPNNWNWPAGANSPKVTARIIASAGHSREASTAVNGIASAAAAQGSAPSTPSLGHRAIPSLPPKPPVNPRLPSMPPPVPAAARQPMAGRPVPTATPENSWLQTTCFAALSTLVELFDHFYSSVSFMLADLLSLINSCILHDSDDLARIGIRCLLMLLTKVGSKLSIGAWWVALESIAEIMQRTMPTELMTPKLRAILGLPEVDSNQADETTETTSSQNSRPTSRRNSAAAPINANATAQAEPTVSPPTDAATPTVSDVPAALSVNVAAASTPTAQPSTPSASPASVSPAKGVSSLSPLPPPTGSTPALPFASHIIVGKFRVQLQLLEAVFQIADTFFPSKEGEQARQRGAALHTTNKTPDSPSQGAEIDFPGGPDHPSFDDHGEVTLSTTDDQIIGHLTCEQLFFALDVLSSSLSFARSFNLNLLLRRKLYSFGFQTEQTVLGRLPQLFLQETRATRLYMQLLFRLICDGGAGESNEHKKASMDGARWMALYAHKSCDDDSTFATIVPNSYQSYVDVSEERAILIALRFLSDYVSKSVSGQMVSLEFSDELLCSFIDHLQRVSAVSPVRFQNYMSIFYLPLVQLIPFGREHIRHHLGRLFQTAMTSMMPFTPITPFNMQKLNANYTTTTQSNGTQQGQTNANTNNHNATTPNELQRQ